MEPINVVLDSSVFLTKGGTVSHVLDDCLIIDAGQNTKWVMNIMEVFGQVEHPFYLVRWPKDMSNPNLAVNDVVYMNMTNAHFILPAQLNSVGTDASNVFDEEPNEKERVFIECTEDVVNNEIRSCRSAE